MPSMLAMLLPFVSLVASTVTRCAASASRLIRVMELGKPAALLSCPWKRKLVPYL